MAKKRLQVPRIISNEPMGRLPRVILLGSKRSRLAFQLVAKLLRFPEPLQLSMASSASQVAAQARQLAPQLTIVEDALLGEQPSELMLRQIAQISPAVLLVRPKRISRFAPLISHSNVQCVTRAGDFVALLAALVERQTPLNQPSVDSAAGSEATNAASLAEVLRHEINNPLTGILGNAEMLLSQRDRLPPGAVQRLETVVSLAVRLRETIRRLTGAQANCSPAVRSA